MSRKPTYDQLERRVQELEHETNKRKLAEEALQHSEQWFRTIVNVLPQFVSYVDKDLRYRFVNQTYQEAFGLAPEDIVGKTLPEVIGRVAFEEARTHVAKALAGEAVRYHQRYQYATGGTRDIDGRLIPDRDEQGLVQGYYAVLTDITPYVKVQEELKESEHKYRNLVNNFPGITYQFVMTAQGDIYFDCIGDQCSDMLGLSSQEIMADAEIIFKRIPEPDADKVRRAILESADALTPYEVEHRIVKPDGQINWVHASSVPRKLANGDIIWDGIGVDVTDRKLAEEALKRSYQELELRNHVAALFLTSPKDRLYHDILNLLLQEFDSQYGYVGYIDENGDLVCPSMTQDIWSKCRVQGKSIVFPRHSWRGIWGTSLQERRAMMRNDGLKPPDGHVTLHNALIVPLIANNQLCGQIGLANRPAGYTETDQNRLETLAKFIAPVLQIYIDKEKALLELQAHTRKLEEKNTALKVLLEYRNEEKRKATDSILQSFERLVFPYFERLKSCQNKEEMSTILDIIEMNTRESLAPLEKPAFSIYRNFTPLEIQVADLIKAGKTSKEIAALLKISPRSVFFHRNNIRRKLGIHNKKSNLRSYLTSLA